MTATTVSVSIDRPSRAVYGFVSEPSNLPQWATGLARSVRRDAESWIAESPQGPVRVRFVPPNDFGVMDHHVRVAPDREVFVPIRVVPNGAGSEVLITVFQLPEMSAAKYREDLALVRADLERLKRVLESRQ